MTTLGVVTSSLPTVKDVKDVLDGLLGRSVDVKDTPPWSPGSAEPGVVAEYCTDKLQLRALAITDLRLSILLGAAIGLLPRGGAEDMIADRDPTPTVMENLYEILNILTSTLNTPTAPHVRITRMHELGAQLPPDVANLATGLLSRLDLSVTIPSYGTGRLVIIVV